jgi:hypothetical protein
MSVAIMHAVAVVVWCLIGLLLIVGVIEIIKIRPRSTPAEEAKSRISAKCRFVRSSMAVERDYIAKVARPAHPESAFAFDGHKQRAHPHQPPAEYVRAKRTHNGDRLQHRGLRWIDKHDDLRQITSDA